MRRRCVISMPSAGQPARQRRPERGPRAGGQPAAPPPAAGGDLPGGIHGRRRRSSAKEVKQSGEVNDRGGGRRVHDPRRATATGCWWTAYGSGVSAEATPARAGGAKEGSAHALRRWYGQEPYRFREFARRYRAELGTASAREYVSRIAQLSRQSSVVLSTATKAGRGCGRPGPARRGEGGRRRAGGGHRARR